MENSDQHIEQAANPSSFSEQRISSITWAVILIWAGLVFLASNMGYMDQFSGLIKRFVSAPAGFGFLNAWPLVFLGAGIILLISAVIRYTIPVLNRHAGGALVVGLVFIGIGLGQIISWSLIGPLVLIGIGLSFLLRSSHR